jgi:tetratricopeptide (TPR) repeat protein
VNRLFCALRNLARRPKRLLVVLLILLAFGVALGTAGVAVWAAYHYRAAEEALDRFRPGEARQHLDLYLSIRSGSADAHLLAARAARQLGDLDAAEEHLNECERLQGDTSEASALERALLRAQYGDVDSVEEYLRTRIEKNHPQTPQILDALAQGYLRMYRIADCHSCLGLWLARDPDNLQALLVRGRVWERTFDYARAVKDFGRIVELDPANDDVRFRLADCLLENGQYREGIKHLEELRRRQPHNSQVLVRLAFGLHHLTRSDEARQILDEVVAREPDLVPALTGRGQLALETETPAKAEGWLRRAVALSPYDRRANFALFKCLKQQQKDGPAQEQKRKLDRIEYAQKRLAEVTRKMPHRPKDPALHCELGTLNLSLGKDELGRNWLLSALKQRPSYGPALTALADFYQSRGEPALAEKYRKLARDAPVEGAPSAAVATLGTATPCSLGPLSAASLAIVAELESARKATR